jgi:type II secretory pathway pseudopilin PulG
MLIGKKFFWTSKGFSLVEAIVLIAVSVLVLVGSIGVFSNLNKAEALDKGAALIRSVFEEARSRTIFSDGASVYGVHLERNKVVLFQGGSYSAGDLKNKVKNLGNYVELSSINLSGASEVLFQKLTGETGQGGTMVLSLISDPARKKTITISQTGVVSIN